MKVQNNVNLNTKSPNFNANAVEIIEPGLKELNKAVQRTDLVEVAQAAETALLRIKGVDSFRVSRHALELQLPNLSTDPFGIDIRTPLMPIMPNVIPTNDIAVTATKTFQNPNPPRRGVWGFFVNVFYSFIYPIPKNAVRRVPGAEATVAKLREAGEQAAAELAQLA